MPSLPLGTDALNFRNSTSESNKNGELDSSKTRDIEAPSTERAREEMTNVFSEIHDCWTDLQNSKPMIITANMLKNENIEGKMQALKIMNNDEIFDLIKIDFIKMETLEKQVEALTRQLRESSQMRDIYENRVSTAQKNVFEKMEGAIRSTLDRFHERETNLVEKTNILEKNLAKATSKNEKLEKEVDNLESVNISLEKKLEEFKLKNELLVKNNEELHLMESTLTKTIEVKTSENNELQSSVRKLMEELLETKNEVSERMEEIECLRSVAKKEATRNQEKAKQFENEVTEQCNSFRNRIQREKDLEILEKERHISFLKNESYSQLKKVTEENKRLKEELAEKQKKLNTYNKNFQLYRSQIEGDVRRKLTFNYRQVMHDFDDVPIFPAASSAPMTSDDIIHMFSSLEENDEKEKENEKSHKNSARASSRNEKEKQMDLPVRNVQLQPTKPTARRGGFLTSSGRGTGTKRY